jgi:hypothetical protein
MGEQEYQELRDRVPRACVADRRPLFVATFSDLVRRRPPPDVLLVTNRCQ